MADVTTPDITILAELGDLPDHLRFPMADRFMQIQQLNAMHEWAVAYRWQNLEIKKAPNPDSNPVLTHYGLNIEIDNCPEAVSAFEYQPGLYAVFDQNGLLKGSVLTDVIAQEVEEGTSIKTTVLPSREALKSFGLYLSDETLEGEVDETLQSFAKFFAPEGEFRNQTDFWVPPREIPFEFCLKLMNMTNMLPQYKNELFEIIHNHGYDGLAAIWSLPIDSPKSAQERIEQLLDFIRSGLPEVNSLLKDVFDLYSEAVRSREAPGEVDKQAFQRYLIKNVRAMFNSVVTHFQSPNFSWDPTILSIRAASEALTYLWQSPQTILDAETTEQMRSHMWKFFIDNASNPQVCDQARLYVEWLTRRDLSTLSPGQLQQESDAFYQSLPNLAELAPITTGNTSEFELERLDRTLGQLQSLGLIPENEKSITLLDAGSHTGERWLRPFVDNIKLLPDQILAADRLDFAPADARWQFLQADLAAENFPARVRQEGFDHFDLVTMLWSPLSDNDPVAAEESLNNMSSILKLKGTAIVDVPAGYLSEQEIEDRKKNGLPYFLVEREFEGPQGERFKKHFYIAPPDQLINAIHRAGFSILNPPDDKGPITDIPAGYTSSAGTPRWYFILEKIADPQPNPLALLHQIPV